jgi:hypothetical protein
MPDPYSRTTSLEAGVLPVLIEAMEVRVAEPWQTAISLSLQIPHPLAIVRAAVDSRLKRLTAKVAFEPKLARAGGGEPRYRAIAVELIPV